MTDGKDKPTLDEMWQFIDGLMRPNQLVPDKSILRYEEVFVIYSKLIEFDQIFREILQLNLLKRDVDKEATKEITV